MSRCGRHANQFDARHDLRVFVQQTTTGRIFPWARNFPENSWHGRDRWDDLRVFQFAALHDVSRVRKSGHRFSVHDARVPAAMIEMQMRVDDDVDFFRRNAVRRPACPEARRAFKRVDFACVSRPIYRPRRFRPKSTCPPRESAANSWPSGCGCASSAGATRSHMGLRDHAEHRAAVEAERSVGDKPEFEVA